MSINKTDPRMQALMDMQKDLDPKFNKKKYKMLGRKNAKRAELVHDDYIGYLLDDPQYNRSDDPQYNHSRDLVEWTDQESDDYLD